MPVYAIAQLKFTDVAAYRRYQNAFPRVFARFRGRLLAADEKPVVLEGEWPRDKVVLMAFPDEAEAERFRSDPDYQAIAADRRAGAEAVVLLVHGLEPAPTAPAAHPR